VIGRAPRDVADLVVDLAAATGDDRPALTFYRGREPTTRVTRATLGAKVEALAALFARRLGLRRGDHVAIASPNRVEVPIAVLALLRLGCVVVPIAPSAPADDVDHLLELTGARALLVPEGAAPALVEAASRLELRFPLEQALVAPPASAPPHAPFAFGSSPAVVLGTSGTTGRPKGVVLPHGALLANARAMARRFRLSAATQLAVLPLHHAHALGFGLLTSLVTGGHLVFTDGLDPFSFAHVARSEGAVVASVVPTLLPALIAARLRAVAVPSLRALLVSSAPLATELARRFEAETGVPLAHGWGLSEYTNFACALGPDVDSALRAELVLGQETPCVGPPLDGTEVAVVDEHGRACAPGEPGELRVRGPCRMLGYHRDAEATRRAFHDGWLATGDEGVAMETPLGRAFRVSGRLKELIVRGGEKLHPAAVERRVLEACPALEGRVAALGFAHAIHGEEIGLYVERGAIEDGAVAALIAALEALPIGVRPKVVVRASAPIPRTPTGKVRRRELAGAFGGLEEVRGGVRVIER
jgi:acyl-CoA synthetase (AMP-forming)/AMP-acid ligase II